MATEYHLLTQNGTSGTYWASLSTEEKARYSDGQGAYHVWAGIGTWCDDYMRDADYQDLSVDIVLEVEGAWTDTSQTTSWLQIRNWKSVTVTSKINGVYSSAHHGGVVGGGYINSTISRPAPYLTNIPESHFHGLEFRTPSAGLRVGNLGSIIGCIVDAVADAVTIPAYGIVANNKAKSSSGAAYSEFQYIYALVMFNVAYDSAIGFETSSTSTDSRSVNSTYIGNIAYNCTVNYDTFSTIQQTLTRHLALYNMGDSSDLVNVTFSDVGGELTATITGHGLALNKPVRFIDGGGATAPTGIVFGQEYFIESVTTDTFTLAATEGGAAITYTDSGSGTIQYSYVYDTEGLIAGYVSSSDFTDAANDDFSPAGSSANQVNVIPQNVISGLVDYDINGDVRPNYQPASFPDEMLDAGPFEYDHGNGLAPQQVTISLSGMAEGSVLAVYKTSDSSEIIAPTTIGASGSHSISYSYTGDVQISVVVRKGTSGTKYLPYQAPGLITSSGFALIVNQVEDTIAA